MVKKKSDELSFDSKHPKFNTFLTGHTNTINKFISEWNNREKIGIHPVWLLTGENGIGKATLAYKIARFVFRTMHNSNSMFSENITNLTEDENDSIYQKMKMGGLGDFFSLSTQQEDGSIKNIQIDDIREMTNQLRLTSMEGEWRVCIIDKLDNLNKNCSNSLLKILEEPPEKVLFILIADQLSKVLPTIRSRTHIEKLSPLSDTEMRNVLYHLEPDLEDTKHLITLSNGSVGMALHLNNLDKNKIFTDTIYNLLYDKNVTIQNILDFIKKLKKQTEYNKSEDLFSLIITIILNMIHKKSLENPLNNTSYKLANLYSETTLELKKATSIHLDLETILLQLIIKVNKCL